MKNFLNFGFKFDPFGRSFLSRHQIIEVAKNEDNSVIKMIFLYSDQADSKLKGKKLNWKKSPIDFFQELVFIPENCHHNCHTFRQIAIANLV